LKFKLDLHVAVLNDEEVVVDGMTGEVAKTPTKHKLYDDKLKSVLVSKCHINNFLETVPYIRAEDIKKLKFPIMQIMGMNVHVYVLRLPCRGIYVADYVFSFSFPCNMKVLRKEIEKLIDRLGLVKVSIGYLSKANKGNNLKILKVLIMLYLGAVGRDLACYMKRIKSILMMPLEEA
jgi:hypothetical protein